MTEQDFDKCPECGALPVFGLRCHPKFSLKVGMMVDGEWDMVAFYAHDETHLRALAEKFGHDDSRAHQLQDCILGMDRWDGQKWVEFQ